MFFGWVRRFLFPLFPGLLAVWGTYALTEYLGNVTIRSHSWLGLLPLILLGTTFCLGVLFRQFRISLIAVPCAAVAWRCLPMHEIADQAAAAAAIILPSWFAVSAFQKERRPFSFVSLVALSVSLAFTALLLMAAHEDAVKIVHSLRIPQLGDAWHAYWALPPVALGVATVAIIALLIPRTNRQTNAILIQSLLLTLAALNSNADIFRPLSPQPLFACAITAASALLLWAVLDGAWQHAFIDDLTGLPGRRPLTQHLASLGRHYTVAIMDIDRFKRVNDRHGHDAGDQVLRYIAGNLKRCRPGTAYRFGGEEFVIVFSGKRLAKHIATLEDLREEIAGRPFVIRGKTRPKRKPKKGRNNSVAGRKKTKVTVSIGVAVRTGNRRKPDEVLKAADKALYKAKRGGRNRLCQA